VIAASRDLSACSPVRILRHMDPVRKIAVSCGGTGGHFFPGLATADELKRRGHAVTLWLAGKNIEKKLTEHWQGPSVLIPARGFTGGLSLQHVATVWSLCCAILRSRRELRKDRPDVLLAMGGYSSVGPVVAAASLKIPVVLHEANAVPGRAVRLLSRWADYVALGFMEAASYFPRTRTVFTGFPLRRMTAQPMDVTGFRKGVFTLLVMGGSQGARALNRLLPDVICNLHREGIPLQVIHLSGPADEQKVRSIYQSAGVPNAVHGFLKEMGSAYSLASLAVSRSGAAACAELAAFGVPALFIPYPYAKDKHQSVNARIVASAGGADRIEEEELTELRATSYLKDTVQTSGRLEDMKKAMKKFAVTDGVGRLADLVCAAAKSLKNGGGYADI
jgi:UDP-N-acetylglucosamine--N-acetylmuramyl-(pentapeptide) pyrophosphoryl-undecaprenol N-acetylglucosamine transferase